MRLLIVEDDPAIAGALVEGLTREGFEVQHVACGADALTAPEPDLILLDLRLPDMDGYEVARRIRVRSRVPIIMVTARGEEVDRVVGLEIGADDYMVKPFGLRELIARIHAVMRRVVPGPDPGRPVRAGRVEIDLRTRRVTVDGREVALTPKEFDLLALLAEDPGAVVDRPRILREVWATSWYGPSKAIDMHVSGLRRKLGDPGIIETVRGVGFRLRAT